MRIVLHFDAEGGWTLLTDIPGATCYCVDDNAPSDRVYRMTDTGSAAEIDALLAGEEIGSLDDDSGQTQRTRAILERGPGGRPRLTVIKSEAK